jgi:hypothetical protein
VVCVRYLNLDLIHDKEKESARQFRALGELESWTEAFRSGVGLLNYCQAESNRAHQLGNADNASGFFQWAKLAARDGAMSIYHFGRVIEGISDFLSHCPTLRNQMDGHALRSARVRFEHKFPWYIDLRHSIAHSAERSHTQQARKKHRVKGPNKVAGGGLNITVSPGSSFQLIESLRGTQYSSMWEGKITSCDITPEMGNYLSTIHQAYYSAFEPFLGEPDPAPKISFHSEPPPDATIVQMT